MGRIKKGFKKNIKKARDISNKLLGNIRESARKDREQARKLKRRLGFKSQ